MAYRYSNTDKWSDGWFSNMKANEKLLFMYLCDNCDIAGFIEVNIKRWTSDIGYDKNIIEGALKGLQRGFIYSNSGDCIYIRNFLKHQKNLPLNPEKNMSHRGILKRFELYKEKFNISNIDEFLEGASKGVQSPYGNGIGNGSGNGLGKTENYLILFNRVIEENNLVLPEGFKELIIEWLKYKSERNQSYKETGLKSLIIKFMIDNKGDYETAREMILYSTSNNYDGLFKEKKHGTDKKDNGATAEDIFGTVVKNFGTGR
jgi:hypothetical protein